MISSNSGEVFIIPNAFEHDYFKLEEGNHEVHENGNILLKNVRLFTLNHTSTWNPTFYPATASALNAVHNWCKRGQEGIYFGELNHPQLDGNPAYENHEERIRRFAELREERRSMSYLNTRMLFEAGGDLCLPGPWVVADVLIHAKGDPEREYTYEYLKNGGFWRFALRCSVTNERHFGSPSQKHILRIITFDIITKEMDDHIKTIVEQCEQKRREQNKRDAESPEANVALDAPVKEVSPKVQALIDRALPSGFKDVCEGRMYLEKRDDE